MILFLGYKALQQGTHMGTAKIKRQKNLNIPYPASRTSKAHL